MDTTYAVSAAAWSALGYVLGFVSRNLVTRFPRKGSGKKVTEPLRHRGLALFVVLVTLVSAAQLAWFSYQQRQTTSCQAKYNQAFINALRVRTSISNDDRESLARMIEAIVNSTSPEENRKAFADYLATKARNDEERKQAQAQYPDFPTDSC